MNIQDYFSFTRENTTAWTKVLDSLFPHFSFFKLFNLFVYFDVNIQNQMLFMQSLNSFDIELCPGK